MRLDFGRLLWLVVLGATTPLVTQCAWAQYILADDEAFAHLYQFKVVSYQQVRDIPVNEYRGWDDSCTAARVAKLLADAPGVLVDAWVTATRAVYFSSHPPKESVETVAALPHLQVGKWRKAGFLRRFFFASAEEDPFALVPNGSLLVLLSYRHDCDEIGCVLWPCVLGVDELVSVDGLEDAARPPTSGDSSTESASPISAQSPDSSAQQPGAPAATQGKK